MAGIVAALAWTGQRDRGGEARAFNVGGGSRDRLDRLVALIGTTVGRPIRLEHHPDQPGDVPLTAADLRRSGAELGYQPAVGIEEGLRLFVDWYEEEHGRQP